MWVMTSAEARGFQCAQFVEIVYSEKWNLGLKVGWS